MRNTLLVVISALAFALGACAKKDEAPKTTTTASPPPASAPAAGVSVAKVSVGNAVGADKRVKGGASSIAPNDTIYVSIDTTGTGDATLKSRWTFLKDGKSTLVKEDTQRVSLTGPATHEFHISKPDAWPKGEYQVEVFVNEAAAGTSRFTVT